MSADLSGQVFERWTVIGMLPDRCCDCVCVCGTRRVVPRTALLRGGSRSCGCLSREVSRDFHHVHGERKARTPEYTAWMNAKRRCIDPKNRGYADYGGRGIRMCAEWMASYEAFLRHIGRKPTPAFTLDRIDVNGDYEPGNVRWANRSVQRLNSRNPGRGLNGRVKGIKGLLPSRHVIKAHPDKTY